MKLNTMRLYPSLPLSSYTLCGKYGLRTYENGYQQDYFFTAPICRRNSLVERRFTKRGLGFVFYGSSSDITVTSKGVQLKNDTITVSLEWEKEQFFEMSPTGEQLISSDLILRPTFNGITVTQQYARPIFFTFSACEEAVGHIRMNSKCFAYMEEKFKPYVTLNALYATSVVNKATGVELAMKQTSATSFQFRMRALANEVKSLTWCINMYEPKLIQDTTVESQRPKENNVYGEVAFLGRSAEHGLQYLYSRFDFSKIAVDTTKKIKKILLHVPSEPAEGLQFRVSAPIRRFCSFGSNWENKMPTDYIGAKYCYQNSCVVFDLTHHLLNENGKWRENTGIVFAPLKAEKAILWATADNYDTPQIIEIQYEKE